MTIKIDRFPHAAYSLETRLGSLCLYYALYEPTKPQWKNESYSPEILNYKVGLKTSIEYFLRGYTALLDHVRTTHEASYLYVIPVPASTPETNAAYTTKAQPEAKPRRNRDNRNHIFCELIHEKYEHGINSDLLERSKPKVEKDRLTPEQNAATMRIRKVKDIQFGKNDLLVLVDDVTTTGGTIEGAKLLLSSAYPADRIIMLPIATNGDPYNFQSIKV